MSRVSALTPLIALCLAAPGAAAAGCPTLKPGAAYPWQTHERMPGDKWAEVFIDIDAKGKATKCRMGPNNLEGDEGFWACKSLMSDGQFERPKKDGVPVAGTVKSNFIMIGRKHRQADEAARKRYFAEHPNERSSCYP